MSQIPIIIPVTLLVNDGVQNSLFAETMNIIVLNDYPIFNVPVVDQRVPVGQTTNYLLPNNDPEGFTNTLTLSSALLPYVTFVSSPLPATFTFNPTYSVAATTIPISLSLFDGAMTSLNTFNLIVVNNPPVFTSALLD